MDRPLVHFELFVRRHTGADWTLALATEDRRAAFEALHHAAPKESGAAMRLCKETRDPKTGEFRSLVLEERGVIAEPRRRRLARPARPAPSAVPIVRASCVQPQDLQGGTARAAIGRHLAAWLKRNRVTPFELLHRADLAEQLEACHAELAAALSKAALEQAPAAGAGMESIRRGLEALTRRAIDRVVRGDAEPGFQSGVVIAGRLSRCNGWTEKTAALLDMLDAAPDDGPAAVATIRMLHQPLVDILGAQGDLTELFHDRPQLGDQLLTLLLIALAPEVAGAAKVSPSLARMASPLRGLAARLALALHARPELARARWAMVRRVIDTMADEQMLWPNAPEREIEGLRALGALLARAGRLVDPHDVNEALGARWRRCTRPELIQASLRTCDGMVDQAETLLDLLGDAVGRGPITLLGQRLLALLADRAFERELRLHGHAAGAILFHQGARGHAAPLPPEIRAAIEARLGKLAAEGTARKIAWI
jgi:hypothetical protein